jgi:hypothetical protein
VLQTIPPGAANYNDAQTAMAGILTNTSDYSLGIQELEEMKSLSPTLKGAYQKVCLYRGEQLIQEEKTNRSCCIAGQVFEISESIKASKPVPISGRENLLTSADNTRKVSNGTISILLQQPVHLICLLFKVLLLPVITRVTITCVPTITLKRRNYSMRV